LAECSRGEQKRQNEAAQSVCAQGTPRKNQSAEPELLNRIRRSLEAGSVSCASFSSPFGAI
jgi:hypothetical protein